MAPSIAFLVSVALYLIAWGLYFYPHKLWNQYGNALGCRLTPERSTPATEDELTVNDQSKLRLTQTPIVRGRLTTRWSPVGSPPEATILSRLRWSNTLST